MKKRLFLYSTLLLLIGLLCFFGMSVYITYSNNLSLAKDMVMETAQNYSGLYSSDMDVATFVKTSNDTRITLVAPDGAVLADSRPLDISTLENHLDRPEIQAALNGSPMASIRHSDSLGVDFIYYALKVSSDDSYVFIRAAIPVAKIDAYLLQSLPLLVILILAVALLCSFISRYMVNRVAKPFESVEQKLRSLSRGEYTQEPIAGSYEEIDQITQGIDEVSQILQNSLNDLRDEKSKLDYILNNIGDGLIVLNKDKSVALINAVALDTFGVKSDIVGKNLNYLSFDRILISAVDDCVINEKDAMFEFPFNGRIFFVAVKQLPGTHLIIVALSDVTENRENAKRREEFFANASHELKTPLTAIKGFNELAAINNKDENINKYINGITRETERMLTLIGDMLKLSELENTQGISPVPVSLAQVVNEVRDGLSTSFSDKSIEFTVAGDASINAEQGHVYELVKNLTENAIRYNNNGGKVSVTIDSDKKGAYLFVFDDGIGIPLEEQTRIFERFYRVEKSRSQRNGGTGLGLSIVKHICALYGWKLTLKSKLGVGTEVTVEFGINSTWVCT
ncbi:MAG: ATP-binding protein [Oscillospiraceae bacterium]|nr:ATP-binding protein [Oscillospiraceae bacterium]